MTVLVEVKSRDEDHGVGESSDIDDLLNLCLSFPSTEPMKIN